jgi:hypothetical protein
MVGNEAQLFAWQFEYGHLTPHQLYKYRLSRGVFYHPIFLITSIHERKRGLV